MTLSSDLDLPWLTREVATYTSYFLPRPDDWTHRLEAHISTDKVIYRPNDVIFIEAYIIDAFTKTPIGLNDTEGYYKNFYFYAEIYDPTD